MKSLGIVAIGYNRIDSLGRLLTSLQNANYSSDVLLIISLDNPGNRECYKFADEFEWKHGEKIVVFQEKRLGLREHILKCGNYLNEYDLDAIAVFEDDVWVSPYYFDYYKECVDYYYDNDDIAGISLYSYEMNPIAFRPFYPMQKGADIYFHQYAPSWGQIWMRKQWNDFYEWYKSHTEWPVKGDREVPQYVINWPSTSWLKYHIAYCVHEKKYFVYPYKSLTTNYGEAGQHVNRKYSLYQVCTLDYEKKNYILRSIEDDNAVKYDVFFENEGLKGSIPQYNDIDIDLYGFKTRFSSKHVLTSKKYNASELKSYGLDLRPMEYNIISDITGDDFYIYNTKDIVDKKATKSGIYSRFFYDLRGEKLPIHYEFWDSISRLVRKVLRKY